MYIAPDSTIEFYKTNLDKSYNDTIYFGHGGTGIAAQRQYFNSVIGKEIDNNSYIRKGKGVIYVELQISELYKYDYMGYNNLQYDNKWFYAFIDNVEYINNETTAVYFTIDVMQTWFPFCTLRRSFVIRQHPTTDALGQFLVEEDIGIGDRLVYNVLDTFPELNEKVAVAVSLFKEDGKTQAPITVINGVYQGLNYLTFDTTTKLQNWLYAMTDNGNINDVINIFMFPKSMIGGSTSPEIVKTFANPVNMYGSYYVPKNKKLLSYPYNFLQIVNNEGNTAIYRYENFMDGITFSISGCLSGTPTVGIKPYRYEETDSRTSDRVQGAAVNNYNNMLTIQNFPQCAWAIDTYRAYCALNQNVMSNMQNVQFPLMRQHATAKSAESGLSAVTSLMRLDPGGAFRGAAGTYFALKDTEAQISAQMAQYADLQLQPPQSAGNVSSSITSGDGYKTFELRAVSIPEKVAERIDDYFELFGYKLNELRTPNPDARPHWTYIKTLYTNISGDVPSDDMDIIKEIFQNGVRFWKKGSELGNYLLDNHEGVIS